jgi:hypothetical protein
MKAHKAELLTLLAQRTQSLPSTGPQGEVTVDSVAGLPMTWRIEFEERAAILEYDGGLSRDTAERQALREIAARLVWG